MPAETVAAIQPRLSWALMLIALRYRNFRLVFFGTLTEHVGEFMEIAGILWLVNDLTHSPFWLTFVGSCRFIMLIFLPPVGGVLADRLNRRSLLILALLVQVILSTALLVLWFTGYISLPVVIGISLLQGVATSFNHPARQTIIPNLVNREHLLNAVSLDTLSVHLSRAIGTPIAGYILLWFGVWPVFGLRALGCCLAIIWLLFAQIPATSAKPKQQSSWQNFIESFHHARSSPLIWILILLYMVPYMVQNTYMSFLPIIARDMVHVDSVGYGWLQGMTGIGALIFLTSLGLLAFYHNKFRILIFSGVLLSLGLVTLGMSNSYALSLLILMIIGGMMVTFSAIDTTLLQSIVTNEMRGRVLSLREIFFGLAQSFAIIFGLVAQYTGVPGTLWILGIIIMVTSLSLIILAPRFRGVG